MLFLLSLLPPGRDLSLLVVIASCYGLVFFMIKSLKESGRCFLIHDSNRGTLCVVMVCVD
jgi:hypothetical protein